MLADLMLVCLLAAAPAEEARDHLDHGRYAEAIDAYTKIEPSDENRTSISLGLSRAYLETGQYDEARATIDETLEELPDDPDLLGRQAEIALITGDLETAKTSADAAVEIDANHPAARLVQAEVFAETGQLDEASNAYRWFVRYYNGTQPADAETLRYVALGSLRYARWNRVSPIFGFVINTLCPDMEKAAPDDWRAAAISGALLLEKYNEAQGRPELKRALAINPHAAEVHAELAAVALGERDLEEAKQKANLALETNPRHIGALGTLVDVAIIEGRLPDANDTLETALAVNTIDQELVARKVALLVLANKVEFAELDAWLTSLENSKPPEADSALAPILEPLLAQNPKPGRFLEQLGETLESRRLFEEAERAYQTAVAVMPQLPGPQISLGLLSMRDGDIIAAADLFEQAFEADPFNVRVNNIRKVIGLLEGYEELSTPHFIIRFDPENDRVLAELMAEYLEDIYDDLTGEFGFEPPKKTVIEVYSHGEGQSGHEWFSARMVGLPWLHTIGASTGMMLALAEPTSARSFNWAEVVRHEFVHVITLQQTDFRIPHWYTEALAVRAETFPRPESWNDMLRERVPAGELGSLDELNEAFVRPESTDDWNFAYCQSLLYAEYLDQRFGPAIHREILAGYTAGQSTEEIISDVTKVSVEEFESGYQEYLKNIVAELGPVPKEESDEEISDDLEDAMRQAIRDHRDGETEQAIADLEAKIDEESPQRLLVALIGRLRLAAGDARGAADLFAAARKRDPHDRQWLKLHAAALVEIGDDPKLPAVLEEIAATDPDDALAAKRLAEIAKEADDAKALKRWTMRALHVTPDDAELHEWLATACEKLGEKERAARAREHAAILASGREGESGGGRDGETREAGDRERRGIERGEGGRRSDE